MSSNEVKEASERVHGSMFMFLSGRVSRSWRVKFWPL